MCVCVWVWLYLNISAATSCGWGEGDEIKDTLLRKSLIITDGVQNAVREWKGVSLEEMLSESW